jgi:FixJ family two-component response regulator
MSGTPPIYVAVVDDDEDLCRALARLLRASDIHPVTYGSAEEFLADTKHPQFDCLVLDIQLGGMSGTELAHELRQTGGHQVPVVYLTAHDSLEARATAEAAGCAGYLRKSDPGAQLLEAIRKALP